MSALQPKKKPVGFVCSVCDLPWEKHGDKPTLETCIELLKAEAKKSRPSFAATSSVSYPYWNWTGQ